MLLKLVRLYPTPPTKLSAVTMAYVSAGLFTINISSLYPDYSSVSISDIIVSPKYLNLNSQGERHTITFTSCSYDASSGVISVNYSGNARIYGSCSADVYILN